MKKYYNFLGFGISFVLHATILTLILAVGRFVTVPEIPMVIDFSITNNKPTAASLVGKRIAKANNHMVIRKTPVQPVVRKRIRSDRPKKSEIEKKKKSKPVKLAPEKIKVVKKERSTSKQEVEVVKREEPVHAPPEALQEVITVASREDDRKSATQVVNDLVPAGRDASIIDSGPQNPRARYIKAHFEYIKNTIQKQIIYPIVARKKGWQGRVVISFVVDKDGSIMDINIRESSGFSLLDRSAVKTIKKVAPFPPPPVRAELIVPVNYSLV